MELLVLIVFVWMMIQVFSKTAEVTLGVSAKESRNITNELIKVSASPAKYVAGELFGMYQKEGFLSHFKRKKLISSSNKGLLIDAKNSLRLTEDISYQNTLIVATTGMGKTTKLIVNMILDKARNGEKNSLFMLDPKGELFSLTSGYIAKQGYSIVTLSPNDLDMSIGFNPLIHAKNSSDIEYIMRSLLYSSSNHSSNGSDKFWTDSALHLLTLFGMLLHSIGDNNFINLPNVKYLLNIFDKEPDSELDRLFIKHASTDMLREYTRMKKMDDSVLLSIVATASAALAPIANNENLKRILSSDSFDLTSFRKTKTAFYLQIPVQQNAQYSFLISSFISTLMYSSLLKALPSKRELSVYMFIDEAGSFKFELDKFITITRGYRIGWVLAIQSIEQVEFLYGRAAAETIINGGIGTKIFMGNASNNLTTSLSNSIGKKYVMRQGREVLEPIMQASAIRTLSTDEALIFIQANKPFIQKLYPYYKLSNFKRATSIKPYKIKSRSVIHRVEYINTQGVL